VRSQAVEGLLLAEKERDLYDNSIQADPVKLVVKAVEDCERRYHDGFVERVERRYDAYRALSSQTRSDDEDDWHSNVTTPYVLHTCEGMIATMLEPKPRFQCKPRPLPEEQGPDIETRMKASKVLEETLAYALERADFPSQQRPFMQQDLIAGMSVLKDYWMTERRTVTALRKDTVGIYDSEGTQLDSFESYDEGEVEDVLVKDDACFEVRDVRDFFWPSQAPNVEKAEYLIDRTWWSFAALKRQEEEGYFENVDELKTVQSRAMAAQITARERKLRGTDRTQDLVEVLEYWTPERVITVGNRTVKLGDRKNPLWNGRLPFVVCSSMPDSFQIPGISVVEALAQIQEMLWTLQNQRLDALRMMANMITLIRSDVDDPDAFEWAPNAQWFVEDPAQVTTLDINPLAAQITLEGEALLKGDLQNIMGGLPYASGADSGGSLDQQTATGVSIITSIAQRIIQARTQHYLWAYAKLGKHFLLLYQQFLRDDRIVSVLGRGSETIFTTVTPLDVQGDFDVTIDVTSDSLLRQERRSEASSFMQLMASIAQVAAITGTPVNLRAPIEMVLDAWDVTDKEKYFLPPTPPGQGPAPPGMAPPGQSGPPAQGDTGMTNPDAAAGMMAPSNGMSMSPEASMQRLMAQRGTPAGG
jgi:hypothetical protein